MASKGRYITPRTANFVKKVSNELMKVMGQSILLFKPVLSNVEADDYGKLYKESSSKTFSEPITIPCNPKLEGKTAQVFEDTIIESKTRLTVNIMRETLKEIGVFPNYGDVIVYQRLFFEVDDMDDAKMLHGSPEYKYAVTIGAVQIGRDKYRLPIELDVA